MIYKIEDLMKGARVFVGLLTDIKEGEEVLILTDEKISIKISQAVAKAVNEKNAKAIIAIMPESKLSAEDPPRVITAAAKSADVLFAFLSKSIAHTNARIEACKSGTRMISCTTITEDLLVRGPIKANFEEVYKLVSLVQKKLEKGKKLKLNTPAGTNITADITGRRSNAEMWSREKGSYSGAPMTEVNVAPVEQSINGEIVVDASIAGIGLVKEPVRITIKDGKAKKIEGGEEAEKLKKLLQEPNSSKAYQVAEISMGMNPKGEVRGFILEDESTYGTCHIALGNNIALGGRNKASTHIDMVQWKPTLIIDEERILDKGIQVIIEDWCLL